MVGNGMPGAGKSAGGIKAGSDGLKQSNTSLTW
jgi:hypothetical protein